MIGWIESPGLLKSVVKDLEQTTLGKIRIKRSGTPSFGEIDLRDEYQRKRLLNYLDHLCIVTAELLTLLGRSPRPIFPRIFYAVAVF